MTSAPRVRRSARAVLSDEAGRVLLIRFEVTRHGAPFTFWATPGGAVEPGESDREAAEREVSEELDVSIALTGPVHAVTDRFELDGALVENTDVFFTGLCARDAVRLGGISEAERQVMQEVRWWTIGQIEATNDIIFPAGLGAVLRRLT